MQFYAYYSILATTVACVYFIYYNDNRLGNKYRIVGKFGDGKLWRIWRIVVEFTKV